MSVRCEEDNIHSDVGGLNTWIQATVAFALMAVLNIHMNIQMLTVVHHKKVFGSCVPAAHCFEIGQLDT